MTKAKKKGGLSEEDWKILAEMPSPSAEETRAWRKFVWSFVRTTAWAQIERAAPNDGWAPDADPSFQILAFLSTFLSRTGSDSALSRLMVAATNTAMDCFARANSAENPQLRQLELAGAAQFASVVAKLSMALDHHRATEREEFFDGVPVRRRSSRPSSKPTETPHSEGHRPTEDKATKATTTTDKT